MCNSGQFTLVACAVIILRKDDKILLIRRACTGFGDGFYAFAGGRLDGDETVTQAAVREAYEELGVIVRPGHLKIAHVVHIKNVRHRAETVGFFLETSVWDGNPQNCEPHKCDDIKWFALDDLPKNMLPTHVHVLEKLSHDIFYSEFGWD